MSAELQRVVKESGKARIVIVDTTSDANETNVTDIIVTGSHGGINASEYLGKLKVKGVINNDAGIGKNEAGIAGMKGLDKFDIPAAAVASMSAKIGNGTSTYEQGKISAANVLARKLGISDGMSAKEAADILLEAAAKKIE
jgi:hypothetical protein